MAKYDDMSFKKAFAAARKESGAGKTFTWQGKSYSTNLKEEGAKATAPAATQRPKARPADIAAKTASSVRPAPGGAGAMPAAKPAKAAARAAQFEPTARPSQGPKPSTNASRMAAAKTEAAARRTATRAQAGVGAAKPAAKPATAPAGKGRNVFKAIGDFLGSGGLAGKRARERAMNRPTREKK